MEIVTGEPAPQLERADAVRLLEEMAAVVRTIFGVEASASAAPPASQPAPAVAVPATAPLTPPAPAPVVAPAPVAAPGVPASIPVPGAAILQEIAFLDD